MNKGLLIKLSKMILKLAETKTDKGVLVSEGELVEGIEAFIEDENGEMIPAANGEYTTEDGNVIITIEDGKVAKVEKKEVEEEKPAETPAEEVEAEDETPAETPAEETPENIEKDEKDILIESLNAKIVEKDIEIETLNAKIAELLAKAEEFTKQVPAFKENVETDTKTPVCLAEAVQKAYNK